MPFASIFSYISKGWFSILLLVTALIFVVLSVIYRRKKDREYYLAVRNEEINRISEGVADGILVVFTNQNFLDALKDGACINIHINVDGSQNIVITGNANQIKNVDQSNK